MILNKINSKLEVNIESTMKDLVKPESDKSTHSVIHQILLLSFSQ
jgi:hypothetical protein